MDQKDEIGDTAQDRTCATISLAAGRFFAFRLRLVAPRRGVQPGGHLIRHNIALIVPSLIVSRFRFETMNKTSLSFVHALTLFAVVSLSCVFASAQSDPSGQGSRPNPPQNEARGLASAEEEMRVKRDIDLAEKQHKVNVNRARDLAALAATIGDEFKAKRSLSPAELKKLEKAEKLAKRIREAAGGEEDNVETGKRPSDLANAMSCLAELTESLKEKVEKTPKRVVSTAIIDEANTILELIRSIRGMHPKT